MLGNQRTEGRAVPLKCPGADLPEADVDVCVCVFAGLQRAARRKGELLRNVGGSTNTHVLIKSHRRLFFHRCRAKTERTG